MMDYEFSAVDIRALPDDELNDVFGGAHPLVKCPGQGEITPGCVG